MIYPIEVERYRCKRACHSFQWRITWNFKDSPFHRCDDHSTQIFEDFETFGNLDLKLHFSEKKVSGYNYNIY